MSLRCHVLILDNIDVPSANRAGWAVSPMLTRLAQRTQRYDVTGHKGDLLGARPALDLAFSRDSLEALEWAFHIYEAKSRVVGRVFTAQSEPVFPETFLHVRGLTDVE